QFGAAERRVDEPRESCADAEQLEEGDGGGGVGEEGYRDQRGGGGDDAPAVGQPVGDRGGVVGALVVQFFDAAEHDHFVVHGQAEGDAEQQYQHAGVQR